MSCATNGCQRASTAGLRAEPIRRGRDAAGGKHDDRAAGVEPRARGRARGEVGAQGLFRPGEIDRQDEIAHFRRAHQHGVGEDGEIRPHLFDEPGDDDAVEHAIGMIGDEHHRPRSRHARQSGGVVAHVERQTADRRLPKALARARIALVVEVKPLQFGLAGRLFDKSNDARA